MLKVNLRHLDEDELHLQGELPVAALDLGVNDELVHAEKPLRYDLTVHQAGQEDRGGMEREVRGLPAGISGTRIAVAGGAGRQAARRVA